MVLKCCVPGCTNKGKFGFHKFPMDEKNCVQWQIKSRKRNLSTRYLPHSHYRICQKHFREDDYIYSLGTKRLCKTSVPSVLVPKDESVFEEHSYACMLSTVSLEEGVVVVLSLSVFLVVNFV